MQFVIDDWHDWLRVALSGLCIYCIFVLVARFKAHRHDWNTKTRDHWYSALMWQVAGFSFFVQGILLDRDPNVSAVIMAAAVLTAGKALHRKGAWGGSA